MMWKITKDCDTILSSFPSLPSLFPSPLSLCIYFYSLCLFLFISAYYFVTIYGIETNVFILLLHLLLKKKIIDAKIFESNFMS